MKDSVCEALYPIQTSWAHDANFVPFEQSKNAHSVPILSEVLFAHNSQLAFGTGARDMHEREQKVKY